MDPIDFEEARRKAEAFEREECEREALLSPLLRVPVSDVMEAPPPAPEFVITPWFPRRHVTLLGGHGGTGKSYLALVLAAHVAAGVEFAGMEVQRGPVVFVTLEDEADVVLFRLRRVIDEYGLNPFKVQERFIVLDGTEQYTALLATQADHANAAPFLTAAYNQLRAEAKGATMVVIDNASDAFDANENTRRVVRYFIHSLTRIARENHAALVLLAHIDKSAARTGSGGNTYSGSTAWHNSCRSRLALINEDGSLRVDHEKLNLGRCADSLPISFSRSGVPVPNGRIGTGFTIVSADREAMFNCLKAAADAGINVPVRLVPGGHSAMNTLRTLSEYPLRFQAGKKGNALASRVLTEMKREGLIIEEQYNNPEQRKTRSRLVVAPTISESQFGSSSGASIV